MSEPEPPETQMDMLSSGLALSALRTLIDRYEPERDGAPIERFEERWELVETAVRKGVVYMADDNRLYSTDPDRMVNCEDYEQARDAARQTADERGHTIEALDGDS